MRSRDAATLLRVARESLEEAVRSGRPLEPEVERFAPALREAGASFVTLRSGAALRGCMGTTEASRPLVADVARNARAAGTSDPRFPPLGAAELAGLDVRISILSPPVSLAFASEAELLAALRPGVDGLILRVDGRATTFLPAVWESLADPRAFLQELKRKAGVPPDFWSPDVRAERYTVDSIP